MTRQDKMFEIFKEHHRWQEILGIRTVGDFNQAIDAGVMPRDIINISEALQEKKLAKIAEEIAEPKGREAAFSWPVLLLGQDYFVQASDASSLAVNGLKPLQISLDDYFVDRDKTPKDENGDYDFESIYALNLDLLNEQFNAALPWRGGGTAEIRFPQGKSMKSGKKLKHGA